MAEVLGNNVLPSDAKARKDIPLVRGLLDYFPAALVAVAEVSRVGNEQHNPGEEIHWARGKSTDQADCIMRHLIDRGKTDSDGLRHTAKVAWRALALLQEELEQAGAPMSRASKLPGPEIVTPPTSDPVDWSLATAEILGEPGLRFFRSCTCEQCVQRRAIFERLKV